MNSETEAKTKCHKCGHELEYGRDSIRWDKDDNDLCVECFCNITFECCMCDECGFNGDETITIVTEELRDERFPPGVYRIMSPDYYTHAVIGEGWLHTWALERIADLPEGVDTGGYPCGLLCPDCEVELSRRKELT